MSIVILCPERGKRRGSEWRGINLFGRENNFSLSGAGEEDSELSHPGIK